MSERGNRLLRFLDFWAGVPAVAALGLCPRFARRPKDVRRIALLKTAAIGDTVLMAAAVDDLRAKLPQAEIVLFTGESNAQAGRLLSGPDRVIRLPVKNPAAAALALRREGVFDLWLDFGQWPRLDALLSFFARARWKVGFRTRGQFRHGVYDAAVEHSASVHELENYKALLDAVGLKGGAVPRIRLPAPPPPERLVVAHMFPGGYKSYLKEWPAASWLALVDALTEEGWEIALTGGPSDAAAAEALRSRARRPEKVRLAAGASDLAGAAALVASARLVVSVNTGMVHLAAALERPVIALNGPTSSHRWGPFHPKAVSIQSPLPCSPCLNLGFDYGCPVNDCMKAISLETVLRAAEKILSEE